MPMPFRDQQGQRVGATGNYGATVHNQAPSDPVPPQSSPPFPPQSSPAQPFPPFPPQPDPAQSFPPQPYPVQPFPGQPYPAHPYGQPAWQPPQPERTNRFAIASIVFALVGLGVGSVLGIVFGILALVQLKRRPQRGHGVAITGLVLSVLSLLVGTGLLLAVIKAGANDRAAGIDRVTTDRLEVGQCIRAVGESTEIYSMPVVPCDQPHEAEVYHVFTMDAGPFPGDAAVESESGERCSAALEPYLTPENESLEIVYLYPHEGNWRQDRRVTCIAADTTTMRTTSILD
jgi:hypothetical protein